MSVLGIETATTVCGVALVAEGELLSERWIDERSVHAERLLGFVDDVLQERGVKPGELSGVAVSIGPGSFTGLRIGLSTAKGLCVSLRVPLIAVPTLDALALRAAEAEVPGTHILAALDARRDEVYARMYVKRDGGIEARGDVADRQVHGLAETLPPGRIVLTGDAREKVAAAALHRRGDLVLAAPDKAACSARTVAEMGERLLRAGTVADPRTLEPLYVKDFHTRRSD